MPDVPAWEYLRVMTASNFLQMPAGGPKTPSEGLAALGAEGWEMVAVTTPSWADGEVYYFKRPLHDEGGPVMFAFT